jgi:hypothetical protein
LSMVATSRFPGPFSARQGDLFPAAFSFWKDCLDNA